MFTEKIGNLMVLSYKGKKRSSYVMGERARG